MSVFALSSSFYMLEVFDRVLTSRSKATLLLLTIIATGGLLVFGVLDSLRRRLLIRGGMRVGEALSERVLASMVATSSQVGGVAFSSGLRDLDALRNFIGSLILPALMDVPFLTIYLVVLYLLDPLFLVVVIVGAAALAGIAFANHRLSGGGLARSLTMSARAQAFADNGVHNADLLEGMGMSPTFVSRWHRQWFAALRVNAVAAERDARLTAASKTIRQMLQIALMATGTILILAFHKTGGVMIGATIIGSRAVQPIEVTISSWKSIVQIQMVYTRLTNLLNTAPQREQGMTLPPPAGHVKATAVSYMVSSTRRTVLSNVGFELLPGESLGVIGPSAAGKSTLGRLIVGAWPCSGGAVRLDGANIYSWPRAALGKYIGYLPQDVELFAGTVRDNIARMTEGDPEAVVRAAKLAHAHDLILALPHGYETEIGDNGHFLSGGQSQRIGLARALFGDPRFVVLDEPNSNLDGAGEQALSETLRDLKAKGVTVVVIAHRPSLLLGMTKILVLNPNGAVAAYGPTHEVMPQFASPGDVAAMRGSLSGAKSAP